MVMTGAMLPVVTTTTRVMMMLIVITDSDREVDEYRVDGDDEQ